jgi:hypothetical protein
MKRHSLFIYIAALLTMLGTVLPLSAQQKQEALYVFRNDGQFNAFFFADIDRFEYSRVDTFGVEHDKFVVQEVHTIDSIFRIPLSAIDSVAFVTPETKYKQDVILPDASISDYIVASDSSNWFRLSANTPASMIPKKGSKIVIAQRSKYLPKGLGGIIANVEQSSNGYTVTMGETDLCDIYDKLVINIAAETPEEGNARGRADGEETELLKQPIVIPPIEGTFGLEGSLDVLSGINKKIDKYVEASMDGAGEISFKLTPKIKSLRTTVYADGFFTRYSFYALTEFKFETSAAVQIGGTGRVKAPAFSIEVDPVKDKDGNISKFGLSMEIAPYVEVSGSTSLKYNSEQVSEYHVASNIGGLGLIPGLWFESNQVSSKTETTTCEKSFSIGIGISAKTEAHVGFFEGLKVKTAFSVDLGMKFISDDPVSRDKIRATELFETPPLYTLLNKDNLVRVEDTLFGLTTSISFGRLSVPTIIKIGNKVELFHFGRVPNFRAIGWMPNERCPWKGQIEMSFTPREVLSNTPYGFTIKDVKEDKVIETHWFEKPYNSERKDSKKYGDFFETSKLYRVYPLTKHHDQIIVGDQESEFSLGAPVIDIKDRYVEFGEKWAMKDDSLITNVANVQFTSEKEWLKAQYDRDVAVVTLTAEDLPDDNDIRRCNVFGIGYDKEGKEIVRDTIKVAQLRPVIGSRYAEFDTKAGEQTVKIYTTVGNVKYSFANIFDNNPDDFCSFKVVNDSTLIVSVKENKGVKRTAVIDIKGTSPNGQSASGTLTVTQEGMEEEPDPGPGPQPGVIEATDTIYFDGKGGSVDIQFHFDKPYDSYWDCVARLSWYNYNTEKRYYYPAEGATLVTDYFHRMELKDKSDPYNPIFTLTLPPTFKPEIYILSIARESNSISQLLEEFSPSNRITVVQRGYKGQFEITSCPEPYSYKLSFGGDKAIIRLERHDYPRATFEESETRILKYTIEGYDDYKNMADGGYMDIILAQDEDGYYLESVSGHYAEFRYDVVEAGKRVKDPWYYGERLEIYDWSYTYQAPNEKKRCKEEWIDTLVSREEVTASYKYINWNGVEERNFPIYPPYYHFVKLKVSIPDK